jgi:hypothetical protein
VIPDIERLASDYLRSAVATRVVGKPPEDRETAWVQVTQLDATNDPSSPPEHLIGFLVQFDCYAGKKNGQPEVTTLGRSVRAAVVAMPGTYGQTVVTSARIVGDIRTFDPDIEPARDRRIITARIHAH